MESNVTDHITKLCRHALKHFFGGAGELVLQGIKGLLHGDVYHSLHLEECRPRRKVESSHVDK